MASEVVQGIGAWPSATANPLGDLRGFTWYQGNCGFSTYFTPNSNLPDVLYASSWCRSLLDGNPPCIGPNSSFPASMNAARSRHPGGVNVGACDGSVKFIKNTVAIVTWRGLGSIRGGEVISADAY